MPTLKLDVDQATYERLVAQAVAERRPVAWQAEVTLQRAVQRRRRASTQQLHDPQPAEAGAH